MQLNPARGRKLGDNGDLGGGGGLCSSTPRGDGNFPQRLDALFRTYSGFMQLNPARGRKQSI